MPVGEASSGLTTGDEGDRAMDLRHAFSRISVGSSDGREALGEDLPHAGWIGASKATNHQNCHRA
jgi:hypothetical protein